MLMASLQDSWESFLSAVLTVGTLLVVFGGIAAVDWMFKRMEE